MIPKCSIATYCLEGIDNWCTRATTKRILIVRLPGFKDVCRCVVERLPKPGGSGTDGTVSVALLLPGYAFIRGHESGTPNITELRISVETSVKAFRQQIDNTMFNPFRS
jgi:hypothetical protein